jgi:lipopolysaccharide transport system permease protein
MPREPGRYRFVVSPVDEGGWRYRSHWPALVVDADVAETDTRVVATRVTTDRKLQREHWPRMLANAFRYPAHTVWLNRGLIRSMVRRDIVARYRGSAGDVLWTILNPLLLMTTYYFVFGVVLQSRFPGDPSKAGFVLYFLAGMLPWLAVSEAVGRSALVIVDHRNFVKKLLFPVEILPVNLVIAGLVTELFALVVFVAGLLLARGAVPVTVLWLPVVLVPQVLLTVGLCWFLAALGVYVRDLGQMIGFLLTLWFFLTPICYPESQLPASLAPYLALNPTYVLVSAYRRLFLEAHAPAWMPLAKLTVLSLAVCLFGHAWFYKLRRSFADVI